MPNTSRRPSADQPLDERVSALLAAAAAPTEPGPLPGEEDAVAAFRASHEPSRRYSMLTSLKSARVAAAAALSVGVLVTGGAAVAGTLPGAAQDTAQQVLAELGIDVPGSDGNQAEPANQRGGADEIEESEAEETEAEEVETPEEEAEGRAHGEKVSEFARTTDLTGREKGEAVSELAKQMGEQRRAEAEERRNEKAAEAQERRDAAKDRRGGGDDSEESERGGNRVTPPGDGSSDAPPTDRPGQGGPETGDDASGGKSSGSSGETEQRGGRP